MHISAALVPGRGGAPQRRRLSARRQNGRNMSPPASCLDHIVIDAREEIDRAAQRFAELGFRLTPRGRHTVGSENHLAVFATDYLELLGFGSAARAELQPFPIGLNGLVFKT